MFLHTTLDKKWVQVATESFSHRGCQAAWNRNDSRTAARAGNKGAPAQGAAMTAAKATRVNEAGCLWVCGVGWLVGGGGGGWRGGRRSWRWGFEVGVAFALVGNGMRLAGSGGACRCGKRFADVSHRGPCPARRLRSWVGKTASRALSDNWDTTRCRGGMLVAFSPDLPSILPQTLSLIEFGAGPVADKHRAIDARPRILTRKQRCKAKGMKRSSIRASKGRIALACES